MKHLIICALLLTTIPTATFAWNPFARGESMAEKQDKINKLLREPTRISTQADREKAAGNKPRAVQLYREALGKLLQIEATRDTNGKSWAGLRIKKVHCQTMIDTLVLEEATLKEVHQAVTDTSALEAKLAAEQAQKQQPQEQRVAAAIVPAKPQAAKAPSSQEIHQHSSAAPTPAKPPLAEDLAWALDLKDLKRTDALEAFLVKALNRPDVTEHPDSQKMILMLAELRLAQARFEDAEMLAKLIPMDAAECGGPATLLSAGALMAQGKKQEAANLLVSLCKIYPTQPDPYFNLAVICASYNTPDQLKLADTYYRKSVKLGGKRNAVLEQQLLIDSTK